MAALKLKSKTEIQQNRDASIATEKKLVQIPFTENVLDQMKTNVVNNVIGLQAKEEQFAEVKREWNEQIKTTKKAIQRESSQIRRGYEEVEKELLVIPNYEKNMVHLVDAETGEEMETRRMKPTERQLRIQ